ncbi:hypothetical protein FHX49_002738 [Microbacterium endophyticum]|uniref:HNH nuclease domain-containing protein n=1 Tax=Microbacterium endophyticum TaxID=1526412 RepID=A0A7W4YPV5_9MICO|nr:HNH endonuclease signature motif containing protein [Microbacterium endophyticum]MBB2977141.1 hypothetical protein [Microbacterium endophyticum]NIK36069.1 hypothetical protein [Microbacterium endophyticum]
MQRPTESLAATLAALAHAWDSGDVNSMTDAGLLSVNEKLSAMRRQLDGLHMRVAAEISSRSRPELGKEGLARKTGHRSPAKLIAAATGGHTGDAHRLIHVGEASRERTLLSGQSAPAQRPHVAASVSRGLISVCAAAAIVAMLNRIAMRVSATLRDEAERVITTQATRLTLDELNAVLRRAEAHLDPDGLEPAVTELHGERSVKIRHDASGMILIDARLDPESGAPVVAAIEGIVTQQLRTSRGHNQRGMAAEGAPAHGASEGQAESGAIAEETRSLAQLRADALSALCAHGLGCDRSELPLATTTVVVRIAVEALESGSGVATIDGIEQPIDAATARRMAANGEIIPCVLGTDSEVLDWGRAKRNFTRSQRLALVERDGGCAFCHLPPQFTEAHHLKWWSRDGGTTNLDNGILLCTACHHRMHDEGWKIRIERPPKVHPTAGTVWFVPPPHIDPGRTPRIGGRRRFDPQLWKLSA